jgi:Tfp pilus assembly protein PilO
MTHFDLHLLAALEYPSAPVMLVSTLVMVAFIGVGGWYYRKAGQKDLAERRAFRLKVAESKNPADREV